MNKVKIRKIGAQRILSGSPVIEPLDFAKKVERTEGTIVSLFDQANQFVAKGYIGAESKHAGWILTKDQTEEIDTDFFVRVFKRAKGNRQAFELNEDTNAYRFLNAEGDGLGGLTIDNYAGFYVFSWYNEGIYKWKDTIIEAFTKSVPDFKGIYQKIRFSMEEKPEDFVTGKKAETPLIIKENGIKYAVYLNEGQMTGIFLDQRNVRRKIMEEYAVGKTFLNTFSYTGAFSVAAAMAGATQTTSVDLANRSLERTTEQFEVNGLDPADHFIRVMDVFDYFNYAKRHKMTFDVVVLDPPTFARSKKKTFSVEKDYVKLIEEAIQVTEKDGVIIASTNSWKLKSETFESFIEEAFHNQNARYEIEEQFSLPEDFRTNPYYSYGDYLKVMFIRKLS
ncbi:class I SAM-dependent rRNA methyltransferase [Lacticigenium naphthae]|uniref:class I SAM-dependent rRNA methyltransferase n=1 Tax=Lacticigenium naphthae TaxID=515351 RepID=UPI00041395E3|nr:class I SAM-dependent rRNA methyltransferase [Lacticigenium naphthae]